MDAGDPRLDKKAIVHLYQRLERPLYNVAYRFLWATEESEEVVQEAFLRLWRMRARVRMDSVEPLLFRMALNLCASRWRKRRLWRWVSLDMATSRASPDPGAEDLAAAAELRDRMRRAIESLPMELRKVVLLCELAEMTYDQVAKTLAIPVGTVGSRRHRAVELLRRKLTEGRNAK